MARNTLGSRLKDAMQRKGVGPQELATAAQTSDVTIHNWREDKVNIDHVKAKMLFNIAKALDTDPFQLLLGEPSPRPAIAENATEYRASQDLQPDTLTLAFQLVEDALQGKSQPPSKRAEMVQICYELLEEGLPRAKVLRLVRATAA